MLLVAGGFVSRLKGKSMHSVKLFQPFFGGMEIASSSWTRRKEYVWRKLISYYFMQKPQLAVIFCAQNCVDEWFKVWFIWDVEGEICSKNLIPTYMKYWMLPCKHGIWKSHLWKGTENLPSLHIMHLHDCTPETNVYLHLLQKPASTAEATEPPEAQEVICERVPRNV